MPCSTKCLSAARQCAHAYQRHRSLLRSIYASDTRHWNKHSFTVSGKKINTLQGTRMLRNCRSHKGIVAPDLKACHKNCWGVPQ